MSLAEQWDCVLNGRGYQIDWKSQAYRHQSVPMIRQQSDTSNKPGEGSLNPAGLWRRAQESWHHGAGQEWLDRDGSDPYRFHTSKGVDVWDKWGLSLLPGTTLSKSTAGTNLYLAVAGGALYLSSGQTVYRTTDGTTWATCTGTPSADVTALTSDGTTVYAAFLGVGSTEYGIYTATAAAFTQYKTNGKVNAMAYVKGRLMVAANAPGTEGDPSIWNLTASGAIIDTERIYTHPNASWRWTAYAEGPGHIYAAGFAGDRSAIYKTAVQPDGTRLDTPVIAASMPDGEIVRSMTGYLWFVVIGTDKGIRFAAPESDGYLNIGALIPTDSPVYCGEGQDRFVWYGLTNYDGTSTGLGRLDLTAFTEDLTPAYASDLMATGQGTVQSAATFLDRRWFTVSGLGVYSENTSGTVTSGTLTTGRITYDLPDPKTLLEVRVGADPGSGTVAVSETVTATNVGTATIGTAYQYSLTTGLPKQVPYAELQATLTGAATVRRLTLLADPDPDRTELLQVPLLLRDRDDDQWGVSERDVDVADEAAALRALWKDRTVVTFERRGVSLQVVVDDFTWVPDDRSARPTGEQGTYVVTLKTVA